MAESGVEWPVALWCVFVFFFITPRDHSFELKKQALLLHTILTLHVQHTF